MEKLEIEVEEFFGEGELRCKGWCHDKTELRCKGWCHDVSEGIYQESLPDQSYFD